MYLLIGISYQTGNSAGLSLIQLVKYWSQLDNILSRYFTGVTYLSGVTTSKMISKSIQKIETSTEVQQHTLNFLSEQLTLLLFHPKGRRYSIDMLICAFAWYHKSSACYLQIKKLLCLPSVRLLRSLCSSLDVGEGNVVEVRINQEDLSPLLYATGYVARKLIHKVHCEECKRLFGDKDKPFDLDIDEQHLVYFQCLDWGGLIYSSNLLFYIIQCSYSIFNMCVSSSLECSFVKVDHQKQTLIQLNNIYQIVMTF